MLDRVIYVAYSNGSLRIELGEVEETGDRCIALNDPVASASLLDLRNAGKRSKWGKSSLNRFRCNRKKNANLRLARVIFASLFYRFFQFLLFDTKPHVRPVVRGKRGDETCQPKQTHSYRFLRLFVHLLPVPLLPRAAAGRMYENAAGQSQGRYRRVPIISRRAPSFDTVLIYYSRRKSSRQSSPSGVDGVPLEITSDERVARARDKCAEI